MKYIINSVAVFILLLASINYNLVLSFIPKKNIMKPDEDNYDCSELIAFLNTNVLNSHLTL